VDDHGVNSEGTDETPSPGVVDDLDPQVSTEEEPADKTGTITAFAGILVVAAFLALFAAFWLTARGFTLVPSVTGYNRPLAVSVIKSSELATGTETSDPTTGFAPGVVVAQSPLSRQRVAVGSPVDLMVAVPPTPVTVPDVALEPKENADATLSYALLRPIFYFQLSETVPFGRVVTQMPRAGQQAMTGSRVAVFISLGLGSGGVVVPDVVGKQVANAQSEVAGVYAVPMWLNLGPGGTPSGTIVDQVPAPGSRVPVGSAVPLITSSAN
jgi:serine/threonine-protein kinase